MAKGDPQAGGSEGTLRRRPGPRPGTKAAHNGGQAAAARDGREYFSQIGTLGGIANRERHGSAQFARIGQLGGEQTKARYGVAHFTQIGRIGGQRRRKCEDR
jgi:hypothetical protein